jgi:hypothetical protein
MLVHAVESAWVSLCGADDYPEFDGSEIGCDASGGRKVYRVLSGPFYMLLSVENIGVNVN